MWKIDMDRLEKILYYLFLAACMLVIAGIVVGEFVVKPWMNFRLIAPYRITLTSPNSRHTAYLHDEGFVDRGMSVYVVISPGCAKKVKDMGENCVLVDEAVWSKDSSVIVLKWDGHYILAHDFKSGQTIEPGTKDANGASAPQSIGQLLYQRGGASEAIPCMTDGNMNYAPIEYSEWRELLDALEAGEELEKARTR